MSKKKREKENQKKKQSINNDMKIFFTFSGIIALGIILIIMNMLKPKVLLTVDGVKVKSDEFQYYYSQILSEAMQSKDPSMDQQTFLSSPYESGTVKDAIKKQTLGQIVQNEVLLLNAKNDKYKVNEKELDNEWQTFQSNLKLSAQENQMTLQKFTKAALGVSFSDAEKYFKENAKAQKYMTAKAQGLTIDKTELDKYYKDNKAELDKAVVRHILVSCPKDASESVTAEKKKLADSILEKVKKGEDFTSLAKQYSEDPGSKDAGGKYEIKKNGQMVAEFEDWAFSHKAGDTGIIRTTFGYHIMKLDSVFSTLESQSKEIESAYKTNKYQSMLDEDLNKNKYKIEVKEAFTAF